MNMATKHSVLQDHLAEWLACRGDRVKRGELTKKLAPLLKMHEKSIGRSMKRLQLKSHLTVERLGRPVRYGADVDAALATVWEAMDYPCAENMPRDSIDAYIGFFIKARRWSFSASVTSELLAMSEGTRKLRISAMRTKRDMLRGRSATVSSPLKGMIPIRKSHTWTDLATGYLQTDSVVHCGDLLTSDVVYSVGCVDFRTYWSEYTAQWNKGQEATRESLVTVCGRFPFPVREVHPDTGNEFINYHVYRWVQEQGFAMTRSEPYKKNDNMCIEERNNSIARRHVGYARLDDVALVPLVRDVLETACLLHNHFRPVRRMTDKVRIGARWKRTYETRALTAYERVLASDTVPDGYKDQVRQVHETLDPLVLHQKLAMLKERLMRACKRREGSIIKYKSTGR
jgi:hypothetical protein